LEETHFLLEDGSKRGGFLKVPGSSKLIYLNNLRD
jgi:hypothetical protein